MNLMQLLRNVMRWVFGRSRRTISCAEFEGFILDYLDNRLPVEERAVFERHLAGCDACHDYLAGYQQAVALSKAVFDSPEAPVPRDVPDELVEAILKARTG